MVCCSKQNQEWQEQQSVPKTRHGRTSTATSSTTSTTTTTRDAQSHKHAPSQFSFLEANSNNSRAESINGCFSFGGRERPKFFWAWNDFQLFWLSTSVVAIIVIVLPRANHYDYDHTHTQQNKKQGIYFWRRIFTGFTIDNTVKIHPFHVIEKEMKTSKLLSSSSHAELRNLNAAFNWKKKRIHFQRFVGKSETCRGNRHLGQTRPIISLH